MHFQPLSPDSFPHCVEKEERLKSLSTLWGGI
jgi:hypothetical protein